ncbi:MAG: RNA polymerase sigma factor [Myxococcaceae bacterium]|nr:RNA polymerase sigma factor [Myxococcaceae bacterium]MCI0672622.1 RNA polymerase sigma factor [Myxococcaceae bacterium]
MTSSQARHPFACSAGDEAALVAGAQSGDRDALTRLVELHRPWIYNIALRMLWSPSEAEDATQEILIKVLKTLSGFRGESRFRTWLYRIAMNHLLNMKRGSMEAPLSFEQYGEGLDSAPDTELPGYSDAERSLLIEEAKIGCMTGMLLCLDREQRLAYVLGSVFAFEDTVCAEILGLTPQVFRKRLSRARADLHAFMQGKCGLVNVDNPCRCARKTQAFIDRGFVDPQRMKFNRDHEQKLRDVASSEASPVFEAVTDEYPRLFREHPFQRGPDLKGLVDKVLAGSALGRNLDE